MRALVATGLIRVSEIGSASLKHLLFVALNVSNKCSNNFSFQDPIQQNFSLGRRVAIPWSGDEFILIMVARICVIVRDRTTIICHHFAKLPLSTYTELIIVNIMLLRAKVTNLI